jgi:hypothetical protein
VNPLDQRHLELVTRLRRVANRGLGGREQVERAQQVLAREELRDGAQPVALLGRRDFGILQPRRIDLHDEHVADEARQFSAHRPQVEAGFDDGAAEREGAGDVLARDRLRDVELQVAADEAEHHADIRRRDGVAREREDLVERRQRVAHAAFGRPRDQRERRVVDRDLLVLRDGGKLIADRGKRQRLQLEHLRARPDRVGHLARLGRRHQELHVRRRLLDRLEQRVERLRRKPVDLVDDEDLEAVAHRRDGERLDDDLADGVDAGVGGAVDFEHVDVTALGDFEAGVARPARLAGGPRHAVQRPRQDPRRRRFPDAPRSGEDERLREPPGRDGVLQRLDDTALADDVLEALRAPFASKGQVHLGQ